MRQRNGRDFGKAIRDRRRQLDLTQDEVARRIRISAPYVGHLESGKRHPSDEIVLRLAKALGLDRRNLFFLANPGKGVMVSVEAEPAARSTWEDFRRNEELRRLHRITNEEMEALSCVAMIGDVRSQRDFIYLVNAIRHALVR